MIAYLLNLLDLCFTLRALGHGGVELNPLMQSVPVMVVYKTVVAGALCGWLSHKVEREAKVGLNICAAVFAAVDVWHIWNFFLR